MQIEKYLARLDFHAALGLDVETLKNLQLAHMLTIPFENLDIHLGRKIVLEEDVLFKMIVERQRGGICY